MYISFPIYFFYSSERSEKFQNNYYISYIIDFIQKNREHEYIKTYTTLDLSNINFDLIIKIIDNNIILKLINLLNLYLKDARQLPITKITLENSIIPVVSIAFESELALCGFIRSEPTRNDIWVLNPSVATKNLVVAGRYERLSMRGGSMQNKTNINKKTHKKHIKNKYNK